MICINNKKSLDFRNQGIFRGMQLQWLLYVFLVISFQTSCVFSFNCNFRQSTFAVKKWSCWKRKGISSSQSSSLHVTVDGERSADSADTRSRSTTHLVFYGGGIFFYHQAGVINFLKERYDLSPCTFSGASAGALAATLAAADVDFYEATDLALKMAKDADVWNRKGGLQGIWGPLIEKWLDTLLPNCIDALQDRITLLVTPVPSFGKIKVSRFENRDDLIQCNMASVHLVSNRRKCVVKN